MYNYMVYKKIYSKETIENIAKIKNSLVKFCSENNKLNTNCKPDEEKLSNSCEK